jgi:hypothetical protein
MLKKVMLRLIIDLPCFVVIEMVELLVTAGCAGVLNILNHVCFTLFLLLCKVDPQYYCYCYVRVVHVFCRNPIPVDFHAGLGISWL